MADLVVVRVIDFLLVPLEREDFDDARAGAHCKHALVVICGQVGAHLACVLHRAAHQVDRGFRAGAASVSTRG